jgi:N12 class adenine-specific DNA methylase
MSRIAGLPNSDSQRAFDLFMKARTILDQGGRVVFATATPISNTIAEVFVMMKFLQLETLEQMGLAHFDAWAQAFAETSQGLEMKPDGSGFRLNTRFNRFTNLPELATLWRQVLDVRTAEQLNLPRPHVAGGGPTVVTIPANPELKRFTQSLAERVTRIKNRGVKPEDDNMLKITSEGRKAALDIRLVRPELPEPAECKINALVARIKELYDRYQAQRASQLIFADLATPKGK